MTRILLPLLLLLFSGTPALAQSGPWTVSEVKGVVTVVDARGQRPATVGTALAAGATIRTDSRASAVLVRGEEFVTMRQNAQLRIAPAERERGIIQILQDYGSALFNIGKQPNPHFGVETPYLAAVVKGTTFVITVSREGASLQVTEGAVETSTLDGGARDLIRPGAVAIIAAADPLRMVVEGEGRRVIDSPARSAGGASAGSPPPAASLRPAAYEPSGAYDRGRPRIGEAILSTPRDLGEVTGGFVSGEVVVLAAAVVADNTGRGNAAPVGNSRGRADDGVVCANGTCGAGGDRGGGSGGNGNPGGGGNGNGNPGGGGGNGDGNPGGGGNGNGSPGAGGGNGNSNPGGGGNGNGNPGGGGNGDGNPGGGDNGNGNPGGSGNGDGNPGGGGNGNGNGNPGGGGNGDRNPGGSGGNGGGRDPGNGNPGGGGNGGGNGPRGQSILVTEPGPVLTDMAVAYSQR
ncbi:FecR domain-containing protein [Porphyrobacter sp. CACIAM 03H1]|uniref:FecR domain-containing protein n=1 Tax=Porphyrobacter sp. CACIAM 03H1 TaxID=2003315 RepID=UPI0015619602|nr:FecR domain-containing protein [Porphyrobacter sp. CACIAM 03H1]